MKYAVKAVTIVILVTLLLVTMLMLLMARDVAAQELPVDPLPTVDEVLDNYIEAVGGREALEKLTTTTCTGELIDDLQWEEHIYNVTPFEIYTKLPQKILAVYHGSEGVVSDGFDGTTAWSADTSETKTATWHGIFLKLGFIFNAQGPLHVEEFFPDLYVDRIEDVDGRRAYCVKSKKLDKNSYYLYFSVDTGLLIRIGYHWWPEDYRIVDGVMVPFRVVLGRKGGSSTYHVAEWKHNLPVDDSIFDMPDAK